MIPDTKLETLFALFGMFLVVVGLGGSSRVKVLSIEVGPLRGRWRAVAVGLGLLVLAFVGWAHLAHAAGLP